MPPARRNAPEAPNARPPTPELEQEPVPAPSRTRQDVPPSREPGAVAEAARRQLRGDGRPTPDLFGLVRVILAAGREAGFTFEEAWEVAAVTALGYLSDRRADDWADVLDSTRAAWEAAYEGRRSPRSVLPREVPPAKGFMEPGRARVGRRPRMVSP